MGLAATRTKQRFGLDPRNTAWSNDTSRYGHTMLEKFGWQPGMGLGMSPNASQTSHIKVSIKSDNVGLGAKIKRKERKDAFDNGECAGLDSFQRILGRLNGKEQQITEELDKQRIEKVLNGKWGVHFVQGEVLASTWDPDTKGLRSYANPKKRINADEELSTSENDSKRRKSDGIHKKEKKDSKKKKAKKEKKDKKEKKSKKEKEDKKESKEKKSGKHTKEKTKNKKEKRKEKKGNKEKLDEEKSKTNTPLDPIHLAASETALNVTSIPGRLSVRSRYIRQKRLATMDPKALKELFMVTNN